MTHIDVNGPPGIGKSRVLHIVAERIRARQIKVVWTPRITCRRRRCGEVDGEEYYFVCKTIFAERARAGEILPQSIGPTIEGGFCMTGVLDPSLWPATAGGDVKISIMGRAGLILQKFVPEMQLFYLHTRNPEELKRRLRERCKAQHIDFKRKWEKAQWYLEEHLERAYEHVVYNDGTPEKAASEIERIAGLLK